MVWFYPSRDILVYSRSNIRCVNYGTVCITDKSEKNGDPDVSNPAESKGMFDYCLISHTYCTVFCTAQQYLTICDFVYK